MYSRLCVVLNLIELSHKNQTNELIYFTFLDKFNIYICYTGT